MTQTSALLQAHEHPPTEAAPRSQWSALPGVYWLRIGIVALLFVLLFRHELQRIVQVWRTDPSWSHGFLIPLFSLYFVNQNKSAILTRTYRPCYGALLLLLLAMGAYFFNVVSPSGYAYFRSLSMLLALGAIVWLMGGRALLGLTWLPLLYLLFAIPLPRRYYVALTMPLRQLAAYVAAALLDLFTSVEASVEGVVIDVIYQGQRLEPSLNVAEACSGMRLLMAFLALGVAMAYLHARPFWQRAVLLTATVPIAILCNVVRVTTTGFLYVFVHPTYTQGIYHDMLGLAMLPLAFGLNGFLAWFMSSLFVEDTHVDTSPTVVRRRSATGGSYDSD
ncbi:exosortase/archaeosortase family protein [Planctomycetota bacterium]